MWVDCNGQVVTRRIGAKRATLMLATLRQISEILVQRDAPPPPQTLVVNNTIVASELPRARALVAALLGSGVDADTAAFESSSQAAGAAVQKP